MKKTFLVFICIFTLLLSVGLGGLSGAIITKRYLENFEVPSSADSTKATRPSIVTKATEPTEPISTESATTPSEPTQPTTQQTQTVVDIADQCIRSVVNITNKSSKSSYTGGSSYTEEVISHGTGVIIREDGYIVTCHHVIDGADTIIVTTDDDKEYPAKLVGFDERFDMAVIHIEAKNMPAAQIGNSDTVRSGEGVVIIGNPLGEFGSSVSAGVLSAPAREITIQGTPLRLIQTDAAVNPGNSGGAMFNMRGELIGIVNAKITSSSVEGIGFAIPINTIQSRIDSLITSGNLGKQAVLGVSTKSGSYTIDGKSTTCLEVTAVRDGSAAQKAGIKVGDYLVQADGKPLESNDDLSLVVKYHAVGDKVVFKLYRNGKPKTISVTLGSSE